MNLEQFGTPCQPKEGWEAVKEGHICAINHLHDAWAISGDGENYGCMTYATRDEAFFEGLSRYPEGFYLGEIERPTQPEEWFEADEWLDHVGCQDDYAGDHADGWDMSTCEQRDELNAAVRNVLADWLDRYKLRPSFWNVRNVEHIEVDS